MISGDKRFLRDNSGSGERQEGNNMTTLGKEIIFKFGSQMGTYRFMGDSVNTLRLAAYYFVLSKDPMMRSFVSEDKILLFIVDYRSLAIMSLVVNADMVSTGSLIEIILIDTSNFDSNELIATNPAYNRHCSNVIIGQNGAEVMSRGSNCAKHEPYSSKTYKSHFSKPPRAFAFDITGESDTMKSKELRSEKDRALELVISSDTNYNLSDDQDTGTPEHNISSPLDECVWDKFESAGDTSPKHQKVWKKLWPAKQKSQKGDSSLNGHPPNDTTRGHPTTCSTNHGTVPSKKTTDSLESTTLKSKTIPAQATGTMEDCDKKCHNNGRGSSRASSKFKKHFLDWLAVNKALDCKPKTIKKGWMIISKNSRTEVIKRYWNLEERELIMYSDKKSRTMVEILEYSKIKNLEENFQSPRIQTSKPPHIFSFVFDGKDKYHCGQREELREDGRLVSRSLKNGVGTKWALKWYELIKKAIDHDGILKIEDCEKDVAKAKIIPDSRKYKINYDEMLGSGQFGKVYTGTIVETGESVAIKVINKNKYKKAPMSFHNEVDILQVLNHPGIIYFHNVVSIHCSTCIVMEKMNGDMLDYILNSPEGRLDEKISRFLIYQIVMALKYLHNQNIAHCDLKPENVLLSEIVSKSNYPMVKLCDFGFARIIGEDKFRRSIVGTPAYLGPEVLSSRKYNKTLDIWSIGVIIYVALSGVFPFQEGDNIEYLLKDMRRLFPIIIWNNISMEVMELIVKIFKIQPNKRPPCFYIKNHSWLQTYENYAECRSIEKASGKRFLTDEADVRRWEKQDQTQVEGKPHVRA